MKAYWAVFDDQSSGCVEGATEAEAKQTGESAKGKQVIDLKGLPYPANPRIGPQSGCPSFCWQPRSCVGRAACPRNPCCTN